MRSSRQTASGYFLYHQGQSYGPFTWEELLRQPLTPDTLLWQEGMREWLRAGSIEELRRAMLGAIASAPIPRNYDPEEPFRPSAAPAPPPPARPAPEPQTTSVKPRQQQRTHIPEKPRPKQPKRHTPAQPLPEVGEGAGMGISGMGCFVVAIVLAVILVGVVLWVVR